MMHGSMRIHKTRWMVLLAAVLLVAAACGDDDAEDSGTTAAATPDTTAAATPDTTAALGASLTGVCPDPLVIQLDWEPEAEHGGIYELVGDGYQINADAKAVQGPLMASGVDTGIDVEVRVGGAPVGFSPTESLLYQEAEIFIGFVRLSDAMVTHDDVPVVGVMSTFEKSAFSIYWDPETYPDAETIADLKDENVVIWVGRYDPYQDYFVARGIYDASQLDSSDHQKPSAFIGEGGAVAETGFATAEPYIYEFEVPEWGKPVKVQLIHDTGFRDYFQTLAVREADITAEADCLQALVPIMQQAQVDYFNDPTSTNQFILELVDTYDTGWVYTQGVAEFAVAKQLELGIVSNGDNNTLGDYDLDRVQELLDIIGEVTDVDTSGISPTDLVTNEFIDPDIGL